MSVKRYPFSDAAGLYALDGDICTAEFVIDAIDYDALAAELFRANECWLATDKLKLDAQDRVSTLETALREHNEGCQALCGIGDQEAVACGYRPYFENSGRRCPNCPTYDIIDFPVETPAPDYDPTPWCSGCGAMRKADCKCGPLAANE